MTSLGTSLKTSDLFVKALENEGVEYIFAVPGEATLHRPAMPRASSGLLCQNAPHARTHASMHACVRGLSRACYIKSQLAQPDTREHLVLVQLIVKPSEGSIQAKQRVPSALRPAGGLYKHMHSQARRTWTLWSRCASPASGSSSCGTSKQVLALGTCLQCHMQGHACTALCC